jgi:hypothetical protein
MQNRPSHWLVGFFPLAVFDFDMSFSLSSIDSNLIG